MDLTVISIFGIIAAIVIVPVVFGTLLSIVKKLLNHQQEMARIKFGAGQQGAAINNAELESLREEIMALRDTTTKYDLSVDRALVELKSRVSNIEEKLHPGSTWQTPAKSVDAEAKITVGGGQN